MGRRRLFTSLAALALAAGGALAVTRLPVAPLPAAAPGFPIGRPLPALELSDELGRRFALASLRGAPALLVFFRGAACPSCRKQLAALVGESSRFRAAAVQLVAVSPDDPPALARLKHDLGLDFVLLSDEHELAVTALCAGLAHCEVLLDAAGVVRWAGATESWSQSPPAATLLDVARTL